nr:hypothetical protein [Amycolatopsis acididurans]
MSCQRDSGIPLGRPVVPELVSSTAGASAAPSLGRAAVVAVQTRRGPARSTCHTSMSGRIAASASSVASTSMRNLVSTSASSGAVSRGSIGAAVTPADRQPR